MYYSPRLHHAIITALLCIILMVLGMRFSRYQTACNVGAFGFAVITAVVLYMMILAELNNYNETILLIAREYRMMDDERMAALAFQFPSIRYRLTHGTPRPYFEDTSVTVAEFRKFLQESNRKYIAPERNWTNREKWTEVKDWLEAHKYIVPESASGSHSWLWTEGSYDRLMAYWMAGRELKDLSEPLPHSLNLSPIE